MENDDNPKNEDKPKNEDDPKIRLGDIPSKLCRDLDFWVHSYISRGKPPDGDLLYEILLYKLIFGHLLNKTS